MGNNQERGLFLLVAMMEDVELQAMRLDRSMSWCIQRAWRLSREALLDLAPATDHPDAIGAFRARYPLTGPGARMTSRRVTIQFPAEMLAELEQAAARQDRSLSWLVQQAWCLATARFGALPSEVA